MARKKIGALLEEKGYINEFQLVAALSHQRKWKTKLGQSLIELGYLEEDQLYEVLAEQLLMEYRDLRKLEVSAEILRRVTKDYVREWQSVPIGFEEGTWIVATCEPDKLGLLENLSNTLGGKVKLVLTTPMSLEVKLRKIPDKVPVAAVQPVKKAFVRDHNGDISPLPEGATINPALGGPGVPPPPDEASAVNWEIPLATAGPVAASGGGSDEPISLGDDLGLEEGPIPLGEESSAPLPPGASAPAADGLPPLPTDAPDFLIEDDAAPPSGAAPVLEEEIRLEEAVELPPEETEVPLEPAHETAALITAPAAAGSEEARGLEMPPGETELPLEPAYASAARASEPLSASPAEEMVGLDELIPPALAPETPSPETARPESFPEIPSLEDSLSLPPELPPLEAVPLEAKPITDPDRELPQAGPRAAEVIEAPPLSDREPPSLSDLLETVKPSGVSEKEKPEAFDLGLEQTVKAPTEAGLELPPSLDELLTAPGVGTRKSPEEISLEVPALIVEPPVQEAPPLEEAPVIEEPPPFEGESIFESPPGLDESPLQMDQETPPPLIQDEDSVVSLPGREEAKGEAALEAEVFLPNRGEPGSAPAKVGEEISPPGFDLPPPPIGLEAPPLEAPSLEIPDLGIPPLEATDLSAPFGDLPPVPPLPSTPAPEPPKPAVAPSPPAAPLPESVPSGMGPAAEEAPAEPDEDTAFLIERIQDLESQIQTMNNTLNKFKQMLQKRQTGKKK